MPKTTKKTKIWFSYIEHQTWQGSDHREREDTKQASTMTAPAYSLERASRRQPGRGNAGEPGSHSVLRRSSWESKAAKLTGQSMRKESLGRSRDLQRGPLSLQWPTHWQMCVKKLPKPGERVTKKIRRKQSLDLYRARIVYLPKGQNKKSS